MPRQIVLVVDASPALRETVSVLLAGEFAVLAIDPAELGACAARPNLVIAAAQLRGSLPAGLREAPFLALGAATSNAATTVLARRFTPHQLRRQVALALSQQPPTSAGASTTWRLRRPFLPAAAAATVSEALHSALPLHLHGEAGCGKRALARAIHAAAGNGELLRLDGADPSLRQLDLGSGRQGTLLVTTVDRLPPRSQLDLLDFLETAIEARPGAVRLITTATADLAELVERDRFTHELFYRLCGLVVQLPPLRERAADIPAIVDDILRQRASHGVTFTARALERLANYLWPGNLTELETVLIRTLTLSERGEIDADDILFEGTSARQPSAAAATAAAVAPRNGKADLARDLDMVINELAHDFRNPLVTIKTFAQHCRQALREGADERRFAELTGEAVDHIDQSLENLLHFTRLGSPVAQSLSLDALLAPLVEEHATALRERQVHFAYSAPPAVAVRIDPDQTTYALDNLIRALTRGLAPGESLRLDFHAPDALLFQLSPGARNLADQLSGLLDASGSSPATPLGIAIANTVLERNGVQMRVSERGEPTTVMIRFPIVDRAEAEVERNGTSSRAHR